MDVSFYSERGKHQVSRYQTFANVIDVLKVADFGHLLAQESVAPQVGSSLQVVSDVVSFNVKS